MYQNILFAEVSAKYTAPLVQKKCLFYFSFTGIDSVSGSSCTQPEILDVPETIVTIQAQNQTDASVSSDGSLSRHSDRKDTLDTRKNLDIAAMAADLTSSHGSGNSLQNRFSKVNSFDRNNLCITSNK